MHILGVSSISFTLNKKILTMKKTLLTISLALISMVVFSQAKLEIGLKAGLNSSNVDIDDPASNIESASAFHGGLYTLIKLGKLGIQPEILYSPQNNENVTALGNIESQKVYIDIPVMVKLYLVAGVNIQAGPQFGILTSAETAGVDVKDNLKGSDVSAAIGAGWDAPFGLQANVRYIIGLSDINDLAGSTTAIKNRTLQISVGYKLFKLGN